MDKQSSVFRAYPALPSAVSVVISLSERPSASLSLGLYPVCLLYFSMSLFWSLMSLHCPSSLGILYACNCFHGTTVKCFSCFLQYFFSTLKWKKTHSQNIFGLPVLNVLYLVEGSIQYSIKPNWTNYVCFLCLPLPPVFLLFTPLYPYSPYSKQ